VAQRHYGHAARKLTWLYAVATPLPELDWTIPPPSISRLDHGYHSAEERRLAIKTGVYQRLSKLQRLRTPTAFAVLLVEMARRASIGASNRGAA
jgi:hypothetical protein